MTTPGLPPLFGAPWERQPEPLQESRTIFKDLERQVEMLQGRLAEPGIAWRWARFGTDQSARTFLVWLKANNFEARGILPPSARDPNYAVLFRAV